MTHRVVQIINREGLRAKSAAAFVQVASRFSSQIIVEKNNKKINAKSIMGVLSLGVAPGEPIHLVANGADEKEAVAALSALIKNEFQGV
jgi:phosphocarrier protein HPr